MVERSRNTLKNYFEKGKLPSQENFTDLIDSSYNKIDDGHQKIHEVEDLEVVTSKSGKAIRYFHKEGESRVKDPDWTTGVDGASGDLVYYKKNGADVFRLKNQQETGLNGDLDSNIVETKGILSSGGRKGNYIDTFVPADGKWHTIIGDLNGCYMFEIVAGARGVPSSGKFALLYAIAITTYKGKGKITKNQTYYGSYFHRIKLRWSGRIGNFALEAKTRCNYGSESKIKIQVSKLWFDHHMASCLGR